MIQAAFQALLLLLEPSNLAFMLGGVAVGMVVGVLPGLGGTVGLSLLLPFLFGMEQGPAIAMLIGMAAVVHTADTFPSILLGAPGSSGSQATIMDGYPLAQKGQAGRALSAAFLSSMFGGLVGAITLFLILPIARPLVLAFRSPELFMLALLGLSMVGILSGDRPIRGALMAALGLLIAAIGAAPTTPFYRFTFDNLYLYDGIPLAVFALGLFAMPELLDLLVRGKSIAEGTTTRRVSGWREGLRDVIRERLLVVRSAVLGVVVGFIPGLGGAVVDWLSYGIAAQTSKNSEGFGKGDIRGVIAPESSNNAKEGGALIPTLLFGIPGSGTTAILLGGLVLLGLQPGPRMIRGDLDLTLLIIWTLAIANVFGALTCLLLSGLVARLATLRPSVLAPFLFVIMLAGAFQSSRSWGDMWAFLVVGLMGWVLRRLRFPLPPILIGFVLAASIERNLFISVTRYGWSWLTAPAVIAIGAITVGMTILGVRLSQKAAT